MAREKELTILTKNLSEKKERLEVEKLKSCVKKQWLDVDDLEDTFGTDAAYQIEIVFDWLDSKDELNATSCFEDFINYKQNQSHLFTNDVKRLIIKTATAITTSFSGQNKSELILLAKLDLELKKEENKG